MKYLTILLTLIIAMCGCRYVDDASDTAFKEFKPSTLLAKYEYYKDAHAQLDSKIATINSLKNQLSDLNEANKDLARRDWPTSDRDQWNLLHSEITGAIGSFNNLAADYNAAMAKFNYAFCNVGTLPEGATEPLPRNYIPYKEN